MRRRLAVIGRGLWSVGNLISLLDDSELVRVPVLAPSSALPLDAVLAWGHRPSAKRAEKFARNHALPLIRIEDGFLRSVGLGTDQPPLSIVVDDMGIYYDAQATSRLELLVSAGISADAGLRAENLRAAWCRARISKYNHARDDALSRELPARYVLVVDQTAGDSSISGGLADASSFARMLAAAMTNHPECTVLLKVHPDVIAGRKRGHFDLPLLARNPRIQVVADAVPPALLIEHAEAVYAVTSQMGFEALLHGKPVHVFGMPFYAGWGLTKDECPAPSRRQPASLASLVHAALIAYPRYIDPETGQRCEAERLVEWMSLQRAMRERFPARVHAYQFSPWKAAALRRFMAGSDVTFHWFGKPQPDAAAVVVWGISRHARVADAVPVLTAEDGFLRSVGLGADLVQPLSWVIDDIGIYYDATRPSRLERLLQNGSFDGDVLARAAALRGSICAAGITKYNLSGKQWLRPDHAARVILVPGQVESDASITWGAPVIRRNIDLLRAVRAENPDAWIIYKPHPDVVAGVRRSGAGEENAADACNEIVSGVSMHALLDAVDEVHVITSLTGFEALLRGKRVVCWGQPFYAGWGLTQDRVPPARRGQQRTLDELVAAALIQYPVYVSRVSGAWTTPERALQELVVWRDQPSLSCWSRPKRWFMQLRALLSAR